MLVLQYFEWFGTEEELKAYDDSWKKACGTVEGVKLKGRYMPDTKRFHWMYLIKADSYDKFVEAGIKVPIPDRRKIPSIVNDLFYEA